MNDLLAEEPRSETTPLLSVLCPLLHSSLPGLLLLLGVCPNTLCRVQITVSATMIAALDQEASSCCFALPSEPVFQDRRTDTCHHNLKTKTTLNMKFYGFGCTWHAQVQRGQFFLRETARRRRR